MPLDEMTRRNLELVESLRGEATEGTLLSVLDRTKTPMGARLLRNGFLAPLVDRKAIESRLDARSGACARRQRARGTPLGARRRPRRGTARRKAAAGRATPREVASLGASLHGLPDVEGAVRPLAGAGAIGALMARWDDCAEMAPACSTHSSSGHRCSSATRHRSHQAWTQNSISSARCAKAEGRGGAHPDEERARTGIASLKVGYNKVFGYFIEISNANGIWFRPNYQRRQTLTGGERM